MKISFGNSLGWLVFSSSMVILNACSDQDENLTLRAIKKQNAQAVDLKPVSSEQELLVFLRNGVIVNANEQPDYLVRAEAGVVNDSGTASSDGNYSETNLQVAGVDESDIVKYDGSHLYMAIKPENYIHWSESDEQNEATDEDFAKIRVMRTQQAPAASEELSVYQLSTAGVEIHGLYHQSLGDQSSLIAVSKTLSPYYPFDIWYDPWYWNDGRAGLHLIDSSDPSSMQESFHLEVEGQLVDSRKVGDVVYLVTRFTPAIEGLTYQPTSEAARLANQALVDSLAIDRLLPQFKLNGELQSNILEATDCFIPENTQPDEGYATLLTVTSFNIINNAVSAKCISGYSDGIFASTSGIYLIASAEDDTALHKLGYTDLDVEYLDTAYVKGNLGWRNPVFRLGEHNNVLRVLSSFQQADESDNLTLKHRLTLFESPQNVAEEFIPLGVLPNEQQPSEIGKPGEDIFAVRYVGSRGYAVTFEQIDPLYIFDLSNPSAPVIAGELEIPGVSHQLHPIGEDFLLGIGHAVEPGSTFMGGVKVELFDVRNMTSPESVAQLVFGEMGSHSQATADHHAFSFLSIDETNHRLTLPVTLADTVPDGADPNQPDLWYNWTNTGLQLIEVNTGDSPGIISKGALITGSNQQQTYPDYDWNARSVLHGESVYFSWLNQVWSVDWQTPEIIDGPR